MDGTEDRTLRIAAVQGTPVLFQREATLERVVEHVRAAAGEDRADLVVFPESFVPGYPDGVWRLRPWRDTEWHRRFAQQSVDLGGNDLDPVLEVARETGTWVVLPVTERVASGTLYNTVAYVSPDGDLAGVHRKLVPTGGERLVWAQGQDRLLTVVDVGGVRLGSLICWEMYMPLARAAMYERGVEVLLAPTWDNSDEWVPTLRHVAKEGQLFVVGVTAFLRGSDVPRDLPGADDVYGRDEDELSRGNTTVVAPGGTVVTGPLTGRAGVVVADLDLGRVRTGRRFFDPTGHYSRPDVLRLEVQQPRGPEA